ncbi:hypothetical protein D1646_06235 [Pseudoflavonifractor sp. 60]|uniref:hypothetical protein n=1 Tax=Pseudoflavonifractor sp. 60 TaxID=2304576 RepID=UPI00136D99DF|nr:hypothetical protein [Pseudoflavonifractor sp. 60]NBI66416.1 hypothetical protein [Pseudoflavonifractor sp. 60]
MKNIVPYTPLKYQTNPYTKIAPNIYQMGELFVTSIAFEQEPLLGEGTSGADISQYPLEDLLEQFLVHVTDFYPEKNTSDSTTCYIEIGGRKIDYIKDFLSVVGKHIFCKTFYEDGVEYAKLILE